MSRLYRVTVKGVVAIVAVMLCISHPVVSQEKPAATATPQELSLYAGSKSCIECHGKFYQLWATSRHGLAMQPYTAAFARANLTPQTKDLVIGKYRYRAGALGLLFRNVGVASGQFILVTMERNAHDGPW